ncbi:rab GTPase-binding effector protein 2-like isoform X1 [Amphibalanus amphitrite]|uniref:rab GTPase-binding effector protein 2-like isoform X1 n=1 Tax=Amphibalanus amphitrite TaxID=1232801 RepID=UPI001C91EBCD|nr:rab GTPase-binding effector protein 2-like isoform X1 [Amphibalanus amphitrite]
MDAEQAESAGGDDVAAELEKQRKAMEDDFGKRRAKFKEMFLQKEEELKREQQRVAELQSLLDDSRTQLAVAEVTFENQLDVERRKHAEEIASIQHLEKEQASSSLEDHAARYQTEIRQLRAQLRALQQQQQQSAEEPASFGPHVLTAVTKQLAKKITLGGAVTSASGGGAPASPHGSQDNLDQSMKRAQEDTEMMRSLVIPLEEEIQALKQKLRATDAQLQVQLTARQQLLRADQLLGQLRQAGQLPELAEQLRAQLPEESDGPPPAELVPHMLLYISVLESQNLAVGEDLKYAKQVQSDLRSQLERERQAGRQAAEQLEETQRQRPRRADGSAPSVSPSASQRSLDPDRAQADSDPVGRPGSSLSLDALAADSGSVSSLRLAADAPAGRGGCERCASSESQLQQLQAELKAAEKRRSELSRALERHQQDLSREGRYRKQTEQQWQTLAEQSQKQIGELHKTVEAGEKRYHELEQRYRRFVSEIQDKLRRLTADRHLVQQELNRLQSENDTLMGKYSACSGELQNEFINLPDRVEDLHEMLLKYKEDLISAKIAREHVEETLRNQLAFMKNEQEALQHEKDAINDELVAEVNKLREEVLLMESVSTELRAEQSRRQEADGQLSALRDQLSQQTAKNKQMVAALQTQLQEQGAAKSSLQEEVSRLKTKVATLQLDLDNSEAVQRDFVKLSQSLQMELERIRQSDTEVRWQHEDDVDACSRCHVGFSLSKRKHHCRHCGKIYCADCVNRTVPSGPSGTMARVCEVCHTLLNRDSAPYFSSEAPAGAE